MICICSSRGQKTPAFGLRCGASLKYQPLRRHDSDETPVILFKKVQRDADALVGLVLRPGNEAVPAGETN